MRGRDVTLRMPHKEDQAAAATRWEPDQYLKFAAQRLRPGIELLDRVPLAAPERIWDLGCGSGEITRRIARRWSGARVFGLDSSRQMLAKAEAVPSSVRWTNADIRSWVPHEPADLVYSNAALHWVENHGELFPRLMNCLRPGGCLAVQMPLSRDLPSHRLMRETLAECGAGAGLLEAVSRRRVEDAEFYHDLLASSAKSLDIWETLYLHELSGGDAVFEWVSGSGLRPVLHGLRGEALGSFLKTYRKRLREAYPQGPRKRTLYPFRRLFIVAVR